MNRQAESKINIGMYVWMCVPVRVYVKCVSAYMCITCINTIMQNLLENIYAHVVIYLKIPLYD